MMKMTKEPLLTAKNTNADCIVTPSRARYIGIPVFYITQLIGLAFRLPPKELGLHRNIVSPNKILDKIKTPMQATSKAP